MHGSVVCQNLDFVQEVAEGQSVSTALQPGKCLEVVVAGKYSSCNFNYFICIHQVSDNVWLNKPYRKQQVTVSTKRIYSNPSQQTHFSRNADAPYTLQNEPPKYYLYFTFCFHKLQFGLRQLKLHLPQLVFQHFLLLICVLIWTILGWTSNLHTAFFIEELPAMFTVIHFLLK